ncbi:nicotinamide-nucleotide amidase [Morganella morganii]|uniref:nicotinamide-nucleotide amidase n=1 Tax=Morganella morganii TaxID=582 RepID=UPI003EC14B19|nr:nicotinamide-nucleotide amidase [Morganella morganii]EKT0594065.1 nicotinamide-nucleotide amidase [Morganella morganii]
MHDEQTLTRRSTQLGSYLLEAGLSVTTAESCTGGWIAKVITDIAGSSAYFQRGFVTYSNDAKHSMIGVSEQSLSAFGAVSEAVVREMAAGALDTAGADLAVSVSGIAGPDGGSDEKPVGTVWFGWAWREKTGIKTTARSWCFPGDRNAVRCQAVLKGLDGLIAILTKKSLDTV